MITTVLEKPEVRRAVKEACAAVEKLLKAGKDGGLLIAHDGSPAASGVSGEMLAGLESAFSPAAKSVLGILAEFAQKAKTRFYKSADEWLYFACALTEELLALTVYENPMMVRRSVQTLCNGLLDNAEEKRDFFTVNETNCMQMTDDTGLGQLLWEKAAKVGVTGYSCVKKSADGEDSVVCRSGHCYPKSGMIKQGGQSLHNPYIAVSLLPVQRVEEILPFLTICAKEQRPFVLVAEYMEESALAAFRYHILHGGGKGNFLLAHLFGTEREELLFDLAALCGATVISRETGGFETAGTKYLGTAEEVVFERDSTYFYTKDDAALKWRIAAAAGHKERSAFLAGKVAQLNVGGFGVEQERRMEELKALQKRLKLQNEEGVWNGNPAADYRNRLCENKECEIAQKAMEHAFAKMEKLPHKGAYSYREATEGLLMAGSLAGELATLERIIIPQEPSSCAPLRGTARGSARTR